MPDKWDKFIVSDPSAAPAPVVDKWEKFAVSSAPAAAPDPTALANQALAQNPRSAGLRVGRPAVTTPTPQNVPRLTYAPSTNYYIPPNSRQSLTADSNSAIDALPGSFEGKPENVGQYVPSGPGEVVGGVRDVARGNISRGLHRAIAGAMTSTLPAAPFVAAAAPVATAVGLAGGSIGNVAGQKAATALGATPEQADVAGDVGALLGGYGAVRALPTVKGYIPSVAKAQAGEKFSQVMRAAGQQPIDTSASESAAGAIKDFSQRGNVMPKVVRDFIKRLDAQPDKGPITFEEARDFYSSASRLSANEMQRLTPAMQAKVVQFTKTLGVSLQDAAAKAGVGDPYSEAMGQYAYGAKADRAVRTAAKVGLGAGASGLAHYYLHQALSKR